MRTHVFIHKFSFMKQSFQCTFFCNLRSGTQYLCMLKIQSTLVKAFSSRNVFWAILPRKLSAKRRFFCSKIGQMKYQCVISLSLLLGHPLDPKIRLRCTNFNFSNLILKLWSSIFLSGFPLILGHLRMSSKSLGSILGLC